MKVSILIVTRNHAAELAMTLAAMRRLSIPQSLEVEWIVIDNGSTDDTREVVLSAAAGPLPLKYLHEPRPGQCHGRNRGLAESSGDVILFADDDVHPPINWVGGMCGPIFGGMADACCGGVKLAPHLLRSWMTPTHRNWLAATEWISAGAPESLVGANMAFSRDVLQRIPEFDVNLGPGKLGFWDDTLFSRQLIEAGYRIADCLATLVEHHFDPARLKRESWIDAAKRLGESRAYVGHHWEHWGLRMGWLRAKRAEIRLNAWRASNCGKLRPEGCDEVELSLIYELAQLKWRLRESCSPRNYERRGLKRRMQMDGCELAPV